MMMGMAALSPALTEVRTLEDPPVMGVFPLCPHQGLNLGCFLDAFLSSRFLTTQLVRRAPHLRQHPEAAGGVFSPPPVDEAAPGCPLL